MWIKPSTQLGALASMLLLLAACSDEDTSDDSPRVIASSYPFAFVVERVGGDHIDVENLTTAGGEPHDLELTPRQVADLTDASLVIYENGFQPGVDDAVDQADLSDQADLDVADVVTLREEAPSEDEHGEDEHTEEEHSDEEHGEDEHTDEEHSEEDGDHDHDSGFDPHVWLDPTLMQQIAEAAAERLSEIDPDHQSDYQGNLDRFVGELDKLDAAFETGLADCERRTIVTSHDAFGYLAERYDLEQVPIAGIDPHNEPSPAEQAQIADLVRADGVTTVFTETLVSDDVAQSIAGETDVNVATLDPIEGLSDDTSDESYLSLMRANLEALRQANGCT